MSLGLKSWSIIVAVLAAAVAVWELPPAPFVRPRNPAEPPAVVRWRALSAEARRTESLIQKGRWADSLATLALETRVDGIAVGSPTETHFFEGFGEVPWITPEHLEVTRASLAERLAPPEPEPPKAVVGYFVQPALFAASTDARPETLPWTELYMGTKNGVPVCLLVKAVTGPADPATYREQYAGRFTPDLGMWNGCRLAAWYGLPGGQIKAWLEGGGITYAASGPTGTTLRNPGASRSKMAMLRQFGASGMLLDRDRCLAGIADGCANLFLAPFGDTPLPAYWTPDGWMKADAFYSPFGHDDDYLLWDLERQFGQERFRRFWTSHADVAEAFRVAFGVEPGEWMADWVRVHIGYIQRGVAPARAAYPGTIVLLAFSTIIAGLWARRRRVA